MSERSPDTDIQVPAFFLADHAEAVRGKLYVTGGCWNTLTVSDFPAKHGHMSLAVALNVPWHETNVEHAMRIELLDEDGHPVAGAHIEGNFEVGRPAGVRPGDDILNVMAIAIENLQLPTPGMYQFQLSINDKPAAWAAFRVRSAKQGVQTG